MRRGGCCYLLLGYVSNIRTTFLLHCFLISSHFFINLTCCDRDLQLDSPSSATFQFKFLISKSTGCFGHRWIDKPKFQTREERNAALNGTLLIFLHRVAVVLLNSPNYRTPIGRTDGSAGANPGAPTSMPETDDMPFCF